MLTPANGVGSTTGTVKIDTSLMSGRRTTDVAFLGSNGQRRTVSVVQFGFGKQIDIKEPTVEIENSGTYDERTFESLISANIPCKIKKRSSLTPSTTQRGNPTHENSNSAQFFR